MQILKYFYITLLLTEKGKTLTLSLASYCAERFEDQVSDVVGSLILISSEFHI